MRDAAEVTLQTVGSFQSFTLIILQQSPATVRPEFLHECPLLLLLLLLSQRSIA